MKTQGTVRFLELRETTKTQKASGVIKVREYLPFIIPKPESEREWNLLHGAAHFYLRYLKQACLKGDPIAADKLHDFASCAVDTLQIGDSVYPQLFRPKKRRAKRWPGYHSPLKNEQMREQAYTKEIGLESGLKVLGKQVDFKAPEAWIASNLLGWIRTFRWKGRADERRILDRSPEAQAIADASIGLPPLTRKTFPRWKKAATAALIAECGVEFQDHRAFENYRKAKSDSLSKSEAKKVRGLLRREIKKSIFQRLRLLLA